MAGTLSSYLPQDRQRSLARGQAMSNRAHGAAMFADIAGFTPLTESLTQQFGARRGVEELTRRMNAAYDALIDVVERHGGSVVSFAGDGITCWFDNTDSSEHQAPQRAIACALAMQIAMRAFPSLSLKAAVTTGAARRFVVGDPGIQLLDTLAGATIARLTTAEHLAHGGEVITDTATVEACAGALQLSEWRTDAETGHRFAVVSVSTTSVTSDTSFIAAQPMDLPEATVRPWVLPNVVAREQSGRGEFLTELRPAVALFLRFGGIDFDEDDAQAKLDALVRRVQQIVTSYDGSLLQLTVGDKGNYLYACFGAPAAHEDDARRAVRASLALRGLPRELNFLPPVSMGIARGTLRTGAYGSATRRTFGALGDEVNLAARLMTRAASGDVWVNASVAAGLGEEFALEALPPVTVKGKREPISVFAMTDRRRQRATRLLEPAYRLPMVGREDALATIAGKLDLARGGQGQVIGVTAEAGMGKSRLLAEAIRLARRQGFAGYGGACESSGLNSPYLVWKPIWQALFDLDPSAPVSEQVRHLEGEIQARAPQRLQALALLAPLMDVPIDDNKFTRALEPKDRRNALAALLEDCLKAATKTEPIVLVLEDVHWIDPLSHDLLESLARATANHAVCFVLAYRPLDTPRLQAPRVEALDQFTPIALAELPPADAERLIQAKAAQLYPARDEALPRALVEGLTAKAQGNPFFLEELLNYLRDRDVDLWRLADLQPLFELPASLHTLILSRVDQLTEAQKVTLKVASIIGRLFPFAWLHGAYPTLGAREAVKADLDELARLDITPLDTPEPELAYLFKHIITQEAAYESLAYATRAQLHEQLAHYLESDEDGRERRLDLLAYHYGRSENTPKQRAYFRQAGEAAQASYANAAALDYYERLLPLLSEPGERVDLHLSWGAVLELLARYDEAEAHYRDALAACADDPAHTAACQFVLGKLFRLRGDYATALPWLEDARRRWEARQDQARLGHALVQTGVVFWHQGDHPAAHQHIQDGLTLAQKVNDARGIATAFHNLGNVAQVQGDYDAARPLYEDSLAIRRQLGDKHGTGALLSNLAILAYHHGDYLRAQALLKDGLALSREIGDKPIIAILLNNLALVLCNQGDYAAARTMFEESLLLGREMGDKEHIAYALNNLGLVAYYEGDYVTSRVMYEKSLPLVRTANDKIGMTYSLIGMAGVAAKEGAHIRAVQLVAAAEALRASIKLSLAAFIRQVYDESEASARLALGEAAFNAAFEAGQRMTLDEAIELALTAPAAH